MWIFVLLLFWAGAAQGAELGDATAESSWEQKIRGFSGIPLEADLYLVENQVHQEGELRESFIDSEKTTPDPAGDSNTVSRDKRGKGKDTQLKPFVPSEEIAAEQAVDFPADI